MRESQGVIRDLDLVSGGTESLLGSPDVSSLADTSSAYQLVASMRLIPLTPRDFRRWRSRSCYR